MDQPRIVAVGTAVPSRRVSQATAVEWFGYTDSLRRSFFANSAIEARHLYLQVEEPQPETVDELGARFREGSVVLGTEAVQACLVRAGLDVAAVDFLATTTCTGRLCPSLDAHLIRQLGFRSDVQRVHVGDTGCASAMVALQQAWNHLKAFPRHRALVVAVEVCSATYYLDDEAETAVANAIFADGAAALLLTGAGDARAPRPEAPGGAGVEVVEHRTLIRSEYLDRMGFTFPGGHHRILLSPDVRRIAPAMMDELAAGLLAAHRLTKGDVRHWVLHSAGRRVIEQAQAILGLTDQDVALSREVLRQYGNMSSATVLFVLDALLRSGAPRPGDWGLMVALGPGFAAEGALLRW